MAPCGKSLSFSVAIGAFDSADAYKLVGILLLISTTLYCKGMMRLATSIIPNLKKQADLEKF